MIGLLLGLCFGALEPAFAQPVTVIADFEEELQQGQVQICGGGMNWGRVQDVPPVYGGTYALEVEFVNICIDCPETGGLYLPLSEPLPLTESNYFNFFIKPDDSRTFSVRIRASDGAWYVGNVEELVPLEWQQVSIEIGSFELEEEEGGFSDYPTVIEGVCFSALLTGFEVFGFVIDYVSVTDGVALGTLELPHEDLRSEADVFPNPVGRSDQQPTLRITVHFRMHVEVVLYDVIGRQIGSATLGRIGPGPTDIGLPWAGLSPGTYVLHVQTQEGTLTRKFVVVP